MTIANKNDQYKFRTSLIDPQFREDMAKVLQFGEEKYGTANWKQGLKYSRLIDAAHRHLAAFERGEDVDRETCISHLIHLACNAMMLYYYEIKGPRHDDRPYAQVPSVQDSEATGSPTFLPKSDQEAGLHLQNLRNQAASEISQGASADPVVQLQHRIAAWADRVFPQRTPYSALSKLMLEEIPELLNGGLDDPGEYADVLILVLDIASLRGIDAVKAAHDKMTINERRKWVLDEDTGLLHHTKENDA